MTNDQLAKDIEKRIASLLSCRSATASICPSEVARTLAEVHDQNWRDLVSPTREVAVRMALSGRLCITRKGKVLDPRDLGRGPIRLRLPSPP